MPLFRIGDEFAFSHFSVNGLGFGTHTQILSLLMCQLNFSSRLDTESIVLLSSFVDRNCGFSSDLLLL